MDGLIDQDAADLAHVLGVAGADARANFLFTPEYPGHAEHETGAAPNSELPIHDL